MLSQSHRAGFLRESCVASQGLGLTSSLWGPASINSEISLLAATRYGITWRPVGLAQRFLDERIWKYFLWVDLHGIGESKVRRRAVWGTCLLQLPPGCSTVLSVVGIASTFLPILGCVCLKSFVCSHGTVYHKRSPFAENEWVLKFPVSRAGLNKDACTHLNPLLCKPEVMSCTWLPWKNKVRSKNAFPTRSSFFTFCEYFWFYPETEAWPTTSLLY